MSELARNRELIRAPEVHIGVAIMYPATMQASALCHVQRTLQLATVQPGMMAVQTVSATTVHNIEERRPVCPYSGRRGQSGLHVHSRDSAHRTVLDCMVPIIACCTIKEWAYGIHVAGCANGVDRRAPSKRELTVSQRKVGGRDWSIPRLARRAHPRFMGSTHY